MAKRTLINDQESSRLVKALMDTKDWEKAKTALPDVDPAALDKGWKDYAFKKAGLDPEKAAAEKAAAEKKTGGGGKPVKDPLA